MTDRKRFGLALAFQIVLLAVIPLTRLEAITGGRPISLVTRPVDPYDLWAGYFVTLNYQIEADAQDDWRGDDDEVWLWISPAEPGWTLTEVLSGRDDLPSGEVAIPARVDEYGRIRLKDAGRMYIPEDSRTEVETAMREAKARPVVDLLVDSKGQVVVRRLRVDDVVFGADEDAPTPP